MDVPRLTADRRRTKSLNRGRSRVVERQRRGKRWGREGSVGLRGPKATRREIPTGPHGHWEQMGRRCAGSNVCILCRVSHFSLDVVERLFIIDWRKGSKCRERFENWFCGGSVIFWLIFLGLCWEEDGEINFELTSWQFNRFWLIFRLIREDFRFLAFLIFHLKGSYCLRLEGMVVFREFSVFLVSFYIECEERDMERSKSCDWWNFVGMSSER